MRAQFVLAVAVASSIAGCSSSGSDATSKRRVADEDINTRHIKGTTDVLKNYRYGERPGGREAATEQKGRKPQEKAK
jgi:hypothetical protein